MTEKPTPWLAPLVVSPEMQRRLELTWARVSESMGTRIPKVAFVRMLLERGLQTFEASWPMAGAFPVTTGEREQELLQLFRTLTSRTGHWTVPSASVQAMAAMWPPASPAGRVPNMPVEADEEAINLAVKLQARLAAMTPEERELEKRRWFGLAPGSDAVDVGDRPRRARSLPDVKKRKPQRRSR